MTVVEVERSRRLRADDVLWVVVVVPVLLALVWGAFVVASAWTIDPDSFEETWSDLSAGLVLSFGGSLVAITAPLVLAGRATRYLVGPAAVVFFVAGFPWRGFDGDTAGIVSVVFAVWPYALIAIGVAIALSGLFVVARTVVEPGSALVVRPADVLLLAVLPQLVLVSALWGPDPAGSELDHDADWTAWAVGALVRGLREEAPWVLVGVVGLVLARRRGGSLQHLGLVAGAVGIAGLLVVGSYGWNS